jgi:repressor LexA|tara:strand:+ start:242 stop:460 length:219 start_codon:yes stop_codon:yes gene_type:complete
MDQYGLTEKQLKLFKFIKNYIAKNTVSPSYDEMRMAVQLKSKNSINKYVGQLIDRKWIKKLPGKARSIQIIK